VKQLAFLCDAADFVHSQAQSCRGGRLAGSNHTAAQFLVVLAKHPEYSKVLDGRIGLSVDWPFCRLAHITNDGPGNIILRFCLYAPAAITPPRIVAAVLFVSYYALQVLLQPVHPITLCFHTLLRLSLSLASPSSFPGFPPYCIHRHSSVPALGVRRCLALPCRSLPHLLSLSLLTQETLSHHGFGNCHGYHGRCWLQQAFQLQRGLFFANPSIRNVPI
jgi:hypothetical protein